MKIENSLQDLAKEFEDDVKKNKVGGTTVEIRNISDKIFDIKDGEMTEHQIKAKLYNYCMLEIEPIIPWPGGLDNKYQSSDFDYDQLFLDILKTAKEHFGEEVQINYNSKTSEMEIIRN